MRLREKAGNNEFNEYWDCDWSAVSLWRELWNYGVNREIVAWIRGIVAWIRGIVAWIAHLLACFLILWGDFTFCAWMTLIGHRILLLLDEPIKFRFRTDWPIGKAQEVKRNLNSHELINFGEMNWWFDAIFYQHF
jgi:hypothetical protein